MKVLMVKPGAAPEDAEIENTLEAMQAAVGGYIQAIYPMPDTTIALVCNEEGKNEGLPLNRSLRDEAGQIYDVVAGTFFLCGAPPDSEHFADLSEEQSKLCRQVFRCPEIFLNLNGRIACIQVEDENLPKAQQPLSVALE